MFSQELSVSIKKSFSLPLSMLEGRWTWCDSLGTYYEYLPNGEVRDIISNEDITDPEDGPITYRLEQRNDTVFLVHRYKQMLTSRGNIQNYEKRWAIRISGDCMELISFKTLPAIADQIDEYDVRVRMTRGKPFRCNMGMPITKYILPRNFKGHVTIAFNQPNGVAPEYDALGNRVVRIPPTGMLKTQLKEDAFGTAGRRYVVLIPDSSDRLFRLPVYDRFEHPEWQKGLSRTFGVVMLGFNQLSRSDVDRLFGEPIAGNTLMFLVDTYGMMGNLVIAKPWF